MTLPADRARFEEAFGGPPDERAIVAALAGYLRTLVSTDTPWDRWRAGEATAMTEAQVRGWDVFGAVGCAGCHAGALFTDLQYHNVGIGSDAEVPDEGRYKVSLVEQDRGAFKTPTLRDVTRTAPYFHDGSAETLDEAVRLMMGQGLPALWMEQISAKWRPVELSDQDFDDLMMFLEALEQPPTEWSTAPG
jgi:cytochrome c peroxidase